MGAVAELQAALEEKAALVEQLEESVASLNLASRDDSSGPSRSASGLGGADAPEEEQTMVRHPRTSARRPYCIDRVERRFFERKPATIFRTP